MSVEEVACHFENHDLAFMIKEEGIDGFVLDHISFDSLIGMTKMSRNQAKDVITKRRELRRKDWEAFSALIR